MKRNPTFHLGLAALFAMGPIVSGCNRFKTLEECNIVARTVNPVLSTIAERRAARPSTSEQYVKIAAQYTSLAELLGRTELRNPVLTALVIEYQQLYQSAAGSAREYADAIRDKDMRRTHTIRTAARQHDKRERMLSRRFAAACGNR